MNPSTGAVGRQLEAGVRPVVELQADQQRQVTSNVTVVLTKRSGVLWREKVNLDSEFPTSIRDSITPFRSTHMQIKNVFQIIPKQGI